MRDIYLIDHGIIPGNDVTERLNHMIASHKQDVVFHLAPGEYHLYSKNASTFSVSLSNSDQLPELKAGLLFENAHHVQLKGHGAILLCHGKLSPIVLLQSSHVAIDGLKIDYAPSHNAEGIILRSSHEWADVAVDADKYPFRIENERLHFFNGEEYTPYFGAIEFDAQSRRTAYRTGDAFRSKRQVVIEPGVIRFYGRFDPLATAGNFLTLRYSPRIHPGILVHHCQNVTLDDITLHNTCGLGILTQFSHDMRYSRIVMRPNEAEGRRIVSCHDDGLHFSNNSGRITVEECYFHGLMDDPINVHGTALRIKEITGRRTLTAEFAHEQSAGFPLWAQAGHEVSLIEHLSMASIGYVRLESYMMNDDGTCHLTFYDDLPEGLKTNDAVENLTQTPQVHIHGCYFGSCRARGILVSTPKPVIIENNVFESSGCAILIPGDANYWFESGACRDVAIRNNHFTDGCMISMYQFCEGIISICPEIPEPDAKKPFHQNIRITNNTFHAFDSSVLYALSVVGLSFEDNTIIRSRAYVPWHPRKAMATLKACSAIRIAGNRFVGDVLSTEVVEVQ